MEKEVLMPKAGRPEQSPAQLAILRELKQQPAAVLIGWTPRGLRDSSAPRNPDGTYDGPGLVKWMLERAAGVSKDVDPFLNGADSPALERYRTAKAIEAERRNARESGEVLDATEVERESAEVFRMLKERLEPVCRAHGGDVQSAISAALADFVKAWNERVKRPVVVPPVREATA
jgi:hypothetical protein